MANLTNTYLYLGKRDKTGVRILAIFQSYPQLSTRITSLKTLNLPETWLPQLNQIIFDSRMLWEPWIESADTYDILKFKLRSRGYSNIPNSSKPEFNLATSQTPVINTSNLPAKKIMIAKTFNPIA